MMEKYFRFAARYRLLRMHHNGIIQSLYKVWRSAGGRVRYSPLVW